MKVERYVSKRTLWIIALIFAVISIVALYFGTFYRFVIKEKYKEYQICKATVISLEEYEYEDSDDNTYYHYSAELEYQIDGVSYTQVTDDIFSKDDVPDKGEAIKICYQKENPNEYYVAKYDWMTHSYLPMENRGDDILFTAIIFISMILIVVPMALDTDQIQGVLLGSGLLLMGLDGIVMGFICKNFGMFFLIIFGIVGAIVLYRYLFIPKERRIKEDEASEYLRLFRVVDIYQDLQTNIRTVVFSLSENNGNTQELYSYDDNYNYFGYGDMYQIDKRVLQYFQETRIVNGAYTININGINESDIQPLNPIVKKMFSLTGIDRTS